MLMMHGYGDGIYDRQGGLRGAEKWFGTNMMMATARRRLGPGDLGLKSMLSLDPALTGKKGYPLLLQTGETADGRSPLIDRQHPHDLFMELAVSYSVAWDENRSVFGYFGLPGEPALGPPAFMHRFSGLDNPEAPITHHWQDATHIAYGVATAGAVWKDVKVEGSVFRGREPDQYRWDIEPPKFDSFSGRISFNPGRNWALQASAGKIKSPEQLDSGENVDRVTASASFNRPWSGGNWQTTFVWGQNSRSGRHRLDGYLLESAASFRGHTFFGRVERVAKDDLFDPSAALHGQIFKVQKAALGYVRDFDWVKHLVLGLGAAGSLDFLPAALAPFYGKNPASFMIFARIKLV